MDVDQQGDVIGPAEPAVPEEPSGQILLPSEAHPGIIHVLPYERPFFSRTSHPADR